jgi:hypothetical protein
MKITFNRTKTKKLKIPAITVSINSNAFIFNVYAHKCTENCTDVHFEESNGELFMELSKKKGNKIVRNFEFKQFSFSASGLKQRLFEKNNKKPIYRFEMELVSRPSKSKKIYRLVEITE